MACTLDSLGDPPLILQRGAGDASRQDLALLIQELLKEFGILIINVLDLVLLKPAVFLLLDLYCRRSKISYL